MRFAVIALAVLIILGGAIIVARNKSANRNIVDNVPQIGVGGAPEDISTTLDIKLKERAKLHAYIQEHGLTASLHMQKLYNGENTSETSEQLLENAEKLSNFFKDNPSFRNLWSMHIDEYEKYTLALKNNDEENMQLAKENLNSHAQEFGILMNSLYPSISASSATDAMNEHVLLTLSIIDAHAENDDSQKATQMGKASAQAAKFAEILIP